MSENLEIKQDSKFKTAFDKTVVFLKQHERKILVTATVSSVALAAIFRLSVAQRDTFLKEKGLYDEFWTMDEIPTLNPSE